MAKKGKAGKLAAARKWMSSKYRGFKKGSSARIGKMYKAAGRNPKKAALAGLGALGGAAAGGYFARGRKRR